MKLTGERPLEGAMPSSLLALHDAGYATIAKYLGPGLLCDVGCGVGDYTATLAAPDRLPIGLDYDHPTTVEAGRKGLRSLCGDGERVPLRSRSFDWVCSSHIIEHFVEPEHHVRELARVTASDGTVFIVTPNAPADFENPFHVSLFEPAELRTLLGRHFADVDVKGLDGNAALKADFAARRRLGRRMLRLDPFGLRHRLPKRWFVALHGLARRIAYRWLGRSGPSAVFSAADFSLTDDIDDETLVLFAIARAPRLS